MSHRFWATLARVSILYLCFFYDQGWGSSCQTLSTVKEVLACVVEAHPRVIASKLEIEKAGKLEDVARQRQNPNLTTRNLFPVSSQASGVSSEVDLSQPIELGGKRKGRIESARAWGILASTSLRVVEESILLETLLHLYRLRQIENELEVYDETISTYGHIQKQFKRRSRLTPEQQVATSVFHLAEVDTLFQKTSLLTEKNALLSAMEYALGQKFTLQTSLLPVLSLDAVKKTSESKVVKSNSLVEQSKAHIHLSQAEIESQKTQRWPNLNLGPSYDGNSLGGKGENHTVGFNLSFAIPILQHNKAGIILARQEAAMTEKNLELQLKSIEVQKKKWKLQHDLAISALESGIKSEDIESKHKKIESLYNRGFLPSSMVIEAHRQVLDYTRHQHEQEILATESRYQLYILEGRLFEEVL
ncbi:MAG: TolC family protein [Bdellovibrionales bacterium]|nr:TolC family protein [Bdellovibrionales bacterium]